MTKLAFVKIIGQPMQAAQTKGHGGEILDASFQLSVAFGRAA